MELSERTVADPDCVLILTDHSMFDYPLICRHAKAVVDARNATGGCLGAEFVVRLGGGPDGRADRDCRVATGDGASALEVDEIKRWVGWMTGLEPATSGATDRRSNH